MPTPLTKLSTSISQTHYIISCVPLNCLAYSDDLLPSGIGAEPEATSTLCFSLTDN